MLARVKAWMKVSKLANVRIAIRLAVGARWIESCVHPLKRSKRQHNTMIALE